MSGAGLAMRVLLPSYSRCASTANRHHQWDIVSVCEHTQGKPRAVSAAGLVAFEVMGQTWCLTYFAHSCFKPGLPLTPSRHCCISGVSTIAVPLKLAGLMNAWITTL